MSGWPSFIVIWTGTDCNCYYPTVPPLPGSPVSPITGATLTNNGQTLNLLPYGTANIQEAEWLSQVIQLQTTSSITVTLPYPPFTTTTTYYGSQNSFTTWNDGPGGVFYLQDVNHQFQTNAFLFVSDWGIACSRRPRSPSVLEFPA